MRKAYSAIILLLLSLVSAASFSQENNAQPGARSVMDAHNCYPYFEWWSDRIDRALSAGTPLAIEQDLAWYTDPHTGKSWSVIAHGVTPLSGQEPTLDKYFFERIRPIVEKALRKNNRAAWPIITLNLDFKSEEPQHLAAVWSVLEKYRHWLTTAQRTSNIHTVEALSVKPVLILTGESDAQQKIFYDDIAVGNNLLVFGAVHSHTEDRMASPEILEPESASNYRRWWNNPWNVVERGGQTQAADWTKEDEIRLRSLTEYAHSHGLWIRFYTLDGATRSDLSCRGWFQNYNFGSLDAVDQRWRAAIAAGVDYIATDQYERLGNLIKENFRHRTP